MEISTTTDSNLIAEGQISDGTWVATIKVASRMMSDPEDKRKPACDRPFTKPVRHWVQVFTMHGVNVNQQLRSERTIGPDNDDCVTIEQTWWLTSDYPFIAVHFSDYDLWSGEYAATHRDLTLARQVHKGELGMKPELFYEPEIHTSSVTDPDDKTKHLTWVNLMELGKAVGLSPVEIIQGFAGFSRSTYYEPNVPIWRKTSYALTAITRVYPGTVPQTFCAGEQAWGRSETKNWLEQQIAQGQDGLYVLQSFAYAVIRLMQFGYRPSNEAPESSLRLEAPLPAAPTSKLPILSIDQLKALHDLRQSLPMEVPKSVFQRTAEKALRTSTWRRNRAIDDPSGGVGKYCDEFSELEAFDGQLVIAKCFWTRAGAFKSENYYAGFLAVFPARVANTRHDQSALLRIWLWPDALLRAFPIGNVGGLCPSTIPAPIAECVRSFLTGLGYTL